jgi:hypothetical protein
MTNAPEQAQPCHHTNSDEIDVVPGTPPVPITVWRTPSDEPGPHLGPRLAARLLAAYTSPGDTIHDTTGDPVLRQATTSTGRHYRTSGAGRSRGEVQPVALAVTDWPAGDERDLDPVVVYGGLRRRLRPGGILAVILGTADGQPADAAGLVDVAAAAGLSYLQHIVAVHATATGDQLTPPDHPAAARPPGGAAHIRVHRDLMIFTRAGLAPRSTGLKDGHADA